MECCSSTHTLFVKCELNNHVDSPTRQVTFIIRKINTSFLRPNEGHLVFLGSWSYESVRISFSPDSPALMDVLSTQETFSQLGLDSCCVDQIGQLIHALCMNATESITISIDVSTDDIFCERCYNERVMTGLFLNDEDNHVMVPASKFAIDELKMNEETCNGESNENCTICLEEFRNEERIVRMPCSHVFHSLCIEKWLQTSHYCPLCRFELATEVE